MTLFDPFDDARTSNVATLPEPTSITLERITSAPQDFAKIHPRTGELNGGLTCHTHQTWHDGCDWCETVALRRAERRAEQHRRYVAQAARTGRYGR